MSSGKAQNLYRSHLAILVLLFCQSCSDIKLNSGLNRNPSSPGGPPGGTSLLLPQFEVGPFSACQVLNGTLKCAGANSSGVLGIGINDGFGNGATIYDTPVTVPLSNVKLVRLGYSIACALTTLEKVYCWGAANPLQNNPSPVEVTGLQGPVKDLVVSTFVACALLNSGAVQCWGDSHLLGNGNVLQPVMHASIVTGVSNATKLATTSDGTVCALLTTQEVFCWGLISYTISNNIQYNVYNHSPVKYDFAGAVSDLSGGHIICGIVNSTGKCIGGRDLINPTSPNLYISQPTQIPGLESGVTKVVSGNQYQVFGAVIQSGLLKWWGYYDSGVNKALSAEGRAPAGVSDFRMHTTFNRANPVICYPNSTKDNWLCEGVDNLGIMGKGQHQLNATTPIYSPLAVVNYFQ